VKYVHLARTVYIYMTQQPLAGQKLLFIEDPRLHSDTPQSVGLLWISDRPVAETSIWRHTRGFPARRTVHT